MSEFIFGNFLQFTIYQRRSKDIKKRFHDRGTIMIKSYYRTFKVRGQKYNSVLSAVINSMMFS